MDHSMQRGAFLCLGHRPLCQLSLVASAVALLAACGNQDDDDDRRSTGGTDGTTAPGGQRTTGGAASTGGNRATGGGTMEGGGSATGGADQGGEGGDEGDEAGGAAGAVGSSPGGALPRHFMLSNDGTVLVLGNQDSNNVAVFRVNTAAGAHLPLPARRLRHALLRATAGRLGPLDRTACSQARRRASSPRPGGSAGARRLDSPAPGEDGDWLRP